MEKSAMDTTKSSREVVLITGGIDAVAEKHQRSAISVSKWIKASDTGVETKTSFRCKRERSGV